MRMRLATTVTLALASVVALGSQMPASAGTPDAVRPVPASSGGAWAVFFDSGPLEGSGWAACPEPISLSVDSEALPRSTALKAARAIVRSLQLWERQSGLAFEFTGVVPVVYDDSTGVITPEDGVERRRHLYLALLRDKDSSILSDRIVGLGEPTSVDVTNREILAGEGTFERDYVRSASEAQLVALVTHEIGHALGLGHSASRADVMYPIVSTVSKLGPGDVAGIKAVTRPCDATADPSRDYPVGATG